MMYKACVRASILSLLQVYIIGSRQTTDLAVDTTDVACLLLVMLLQATTDATMCWRLESKAQVSALMVG
jgi:hypothetical protein